MAAMPVYAQESGWRKFGEPSQPADLPPPAPSQLTLPAGILISVRVNQPLSSDHNQPDDAFAATLAQPLVANGIVVARRGQTIEGRVAEAVKAGRVKGTSRLGLELTEITLVDGQQMPVQTQMVQRTGDTSVGQDAAVIGASTGVGAAIGAAADGGFGAGMGALAGAAASTIGVLVTRGRPTEVYPEQVLTFRLEFPLTISTERSEQAFQPVRQEDYESAPLQRRGPPPRLAPPPPPPFYAGYYYPYRPYFYGPGFYGPGFFFYSGRGFYRRW
jgi:hypothetical protein